jgi:hypothetical protein
MVESLLTVVPAALAVILSIGVIPVVASTMRLCEIVMSDSPIRPGSTWQEVDFSWYVFLQALSFTVLLLTHQLQGLVLGSSMVPNRSRHRYPRRVSSLPLSSTQACLPLSQPSCHTFPNPHYTRVPWELGGEESSQHGRRLRYREVGMESCLS